MKVQSMIMTSIPNMFAHEKYHYHDAVPHISTLKRKKKKKNE